MRLLQTTLQVLLTVKSGENASQGAVRVLKKERVVHTVQEDALAAEHILRRPRKRLNLMGLADPFKQRQRARNGKGHLLNLASQVETGRNGEVRVDFCKTRST